MRLIRIMLNITFKLIIKFIDVFIPKSTKRLFFIPHTNGINDKMSLINYASDNVLSFLNYFLENKPNNKYSIYLLTYNYSEEKILEYKSFLKNRNIETKIEFIDGDYFNCNIFERVKKLIRLYYFYLRSKYVFTSAPYIIRIPFKSYRQIQFSLHYFTPFKNDFFMDGCSDLKNPKIDYCFATSKLSAQISSISEYLSFDKFHVLGFSRNDNLLTPRLSKPELKLELKKIFTGDFEKLILYTPTHRDYEKKSNDDKRSIWGYDDVSLELDNILKKHKALLIVKLHPAQNVVSVKKNLPSNSIVYQPNEEYSLYDMLAYTDILISDYTSTYFDYLLLDRPVIFNFYDREKYEKVRGFSFDPIEEICAGDIVENRIQFLNSIDKELSGVDNHKKERNHVNKLMNKYRDANSSQRVFDFFTSLTEK